MVDFPHHHGRGVAVECRRDDPPIEEPGSVVVLGARCERGNRNVTVPVTTEVESVRIGVSATEAGEVGVQRFLNAQSLLFDAHDFLRCPLLKWLDQSLTVSVGEFQVSGCPHTPAQPGVWITSLRDRPIRLVCAYEAD